MSPIFESFSGMSEFALGSKTKTPIVLTGFASSITSISAVLNGQVNPLSSSANYNYLVSSSATTNKFGALSPYTTLGGTAGSSNTFVSKPNTISSITAGSTYYYQMSAYNSYGTAYGIVQSFVAAAIIAPTITGVTATTIAPPSYGTIYLSGSVNPEYDSSATYYWAYTSDTSSTNPSTLTSPITTSTVNINSAVNAYLGASATITPSEGNYIHYQLVAQNQGGTATSAVQTIYNSFPPAPSVTVTNPSTTTTYSAVLSGNVNANYVGAGITSYYFQIGTSSGNYNTNSNFGGGNVSGTSNTPVSVTASLSAGVTYYWRIVATGPGGTTNSSELSFTMAPAVSLGATISHAYNSNSSNQVTGATNRVLTGFTVPSNGMLIVKIICVCTQTPSGGWITDNLGGTWVQDAAYGNGGSSGFVGIFRRLDDGKYGQALTITAHGGSTSSGGASHTQDMLATGHYLANAKNLASNFANSQSNLYFNYSSLKAGSYIVAAISGFGLGVYFYNGTSFNASGWTIYGNIDGITSPEPPTVSNSYPSVQNTNNGNSFYGWTNPIPTSSSSTIKLGLDANYGANIPIAAAEYSSY